MDKKNDFRIKFDEFTAEELLKMSKTFLKWYFDKLKIGELGAEIVIKIMKNGPRGPIHITKNFVSNKTNFPYLTEAEIWKMMSFHKGERIHIPSDAEINTIIFEHRARKLSEYGYPDKFIAEQLGKDIGTISKIIAKPEYHRSTKEADVFDIDIKYIVAAINLIQTIKGSVHKPLSGLSPLAAAKIIKAGKFFIMLPRSRREEIAKIIGPAEFEKIPDALRGRRLSMSRYVPATQVAIALCAIIEGRETREIARRTNIHADHLNKTIIHLKRALKGIGLLND